MDIKLISKLKKLGLTENEAKIYAGLPSLKEATAREIHESNQEDWIMIRLSR